MKSRKSSKKSTRTISRESVGDCNRLLIQTAPPYDHKHGWYGETVEKWAAMWDISPKEFWKRFGVNTVASYKGKTVFYPQDVIGTLKEFLKPGYKRVWD